MLDLLGAERDGLGVREIARRLAVHPSTASRLLGTLAAAGLIERDEATARYRLGRADRGARRRAVDRLPVVSQARPELEHLSAVTAETVNLAIRDGAHVVYVDQVTPAADGGDGELGRAPQPGACEFERQGAARVWR